MTVGDRAKFTAHDTVFREHQREGKIGTITRIHNADACDWQLDGEEGVYFTALADLEPSGRLKP